MFDKAKNITNLASNTRIKLFSYRQDKPLMPEDVQAARAYLRAYWKKV